MDRLQAELDAFRRSSDEAIRAQQNERLAALLRHHYTNPYNDSYRALLKSHGIEDESELPRSVGELRRLPIISRRFLEEADYAQRPGVPPDQVRKIIETSGTAGSPLRIPHTYETVRRCYAEMFVRTALLAAVPVTELSYWVMHWIPGGKDDWASHESSLAFSELPDVGTALIVSTHTTPLDHWENLRKHRPVLGASAPNFFLAFASYAEGQGLDLATSSLRYLLLGGASCLPEDRGFLERTYGLERLSMFYASSESFFCAGELPGGAGYLCYADEFLVEVIDY
ncbi:MAG: hypothetical protein HY329_23960, partial [Chloroflexi bacterium]|nr:hypothetical protein [Chloroflexota bacterium]